MVTCWARVRGLGLRVPLEGSYDEGSLKGSFIGFRGHLLGLRG